LAELKLLRAMQADLNERTEAAVAFPEQLAKEQGYLAELVLEILSRNNENSSPNTHNDKNRLQELFEQLDRELSD
jgi:type II secretory pathway predicted ATPase ExeA